jgi:hypothetical protein
MKKLLCLGLLAAELLATPTRVQAWGCMGPVKVSGGVKIDLKIQCGAANLPLAPWYLYYPAEARFQPIGPAGFYPNWPQQPLAGGPAFTPPSPTPPEPVPPPPAAQPIQRTGYHATAYRNSAVPAYWYEP